MKKLIIFVFAMTVAFIGHSQWIGWLQTDSIVDYGGTDYIRLTSTGIGINKTPTAQFDVNGIALATHLYIQSGGVLSFTNNWAVDGDGIRMFGGDMDFHVNSPLISRLAINQYGDVTAQRDFITTADVQADSGKFNTMVATTVGAGIYALNVSGESDLDSLGFNPLPVATARDSILSIDRSTNKWIVASPKSEFGGSSFWELDGLSLINDTANSDTVRVPDGQLEIGASATTTGQLTLHSSSLAVATINMSNVSGDFKFDDEIFVGNSANASPGIWDYNGMSSGQAAFRNILNTNGGFGGAAAEPEIIVAGVPELTVTATDVTAADDLIATDTLEVLSSNLWTANTRFNMGTGNTFNTEVYQMSIGLTNNLLGDYNLAFGILNTTTTGDDYCYLFGNDNGAAVDYAFAAGRGNTVSGQYGTALGYLNEVRSNYSATIGWKNDINAGSGSIAIGIEAKVDGQGEFTHSSDDYAGHGQSIEVIVGDIVSHADANWYSLSVDGVGSSATTRLTIPASTVWTFTALIVGTNDAQSETFSYKIEGHIKRDGVNNTTLMASTVTTIYESTATFDAQAVADDTNEALLIQVSDSGAGSDIIRWTCKTTIAEQTF